MDSSGQMTVEVSISGADVDTSNPINSLTEEQTWMIRQKRIKDALAAARDEARPEPADLYAAASRLVDVIKRANVEEFISEIENLATQTDPSTTIFFQGLSRGSLLHIAVLAGKDDILRILLDNVHDLFIATRDNWGNTPLHLATKAKAIGVIDMLIHRAKDLPNVEDKLLLRMKNNHGNTALHEAVLTRDVDLVSHLLGEDLEPVYWENVDQKSPLYLALDTGNSKILEVLLSKSLDPSKIRGLPPVHGAVAREQYGSLGEILEKDMKLFAMRDPGEGNVFHLAAFWNLPQVFELLKPETEYLTRQRDKNGDLPIHIASKGGHVALIKKLHPVSFCVNGQGQTILHVAAKYGREELVKYILRHPYLGEMINERDHDGNTPSHLAAKEIQPAALVHLVLDKRMNPSLVNHEYLAAVDLTASKFFRPRSPATLRRGWARFLLSSVSGKRSDRIILKPDARDEKYEKIILPDFQRWDDTINTSSLVATLVTTVTFAAGFTVPGGMNSSDTPSKDDRGMATMLDNRMFQAFVICNTIAMFSSMTSVILFLLGYLAEVHLSLLLCMIAAASLAISLPAMSAAFLTGVILTVGKLPWLATTIIILGSIFILIIAGALLSPMVFVLTGILLRLDCLRPIRPLASWFILAFLRCVNVETAFIADDSKKDTTGSETSKD